MDKIIKHVSINKKFKKDKIRNSFLLFLLLLEALIQYES